MVGVCNVSRAPTGPYPFLTPHLLAPPMPLTWTCSVLKHSGAWNAPRLNLDAIAFAGYLFSLVFGFQSRFMWM